MATTFREYNAPATYQFTFPSYQSSDVKVRVDGVLKTAGSHYNITGYTTTGGGTVVFTSGNVPSSGVVRIYRDTNVDVAKATFTAGSSVKAADLNNNNTQLLYRAQEEQIPNLIHSYDIDDAAIETAKIKAGAVDTTQLANGAVTTTQLGDDAVTTAKIADSAVDTNRLANSSVTTAKIAADAVDGTKIADDSIDSEHYVDGSVDTAHLATGAVTNAKIGADAVNGSKIADDSIDSEHYVDGSIDTQHIGNDQITTAKIVAGAVDTAQLANGAATTAKIWETYKLLQQNSSGCSRWY
ncbi:MAG: hypothetical protein CM15mV102_220 [uncultured marine virus]|nr:MAG: hypothetical protein CM15mV102_220 [uncultured marine virus]